LRRLCQKPARPDAYPLPACSHGAPVSDTVSPPARHVGDTRPLCVANVSPRRNQKISYGTTADDAAVSTFLSDRAAAVSAALGGNPEEGMNCPGYGVTGIRRNETETIFCRVWKVSAVPVDRSRVTIVTRPFRRLLRRGEAAVARQLPRRLPHSAVAVALRPAVSHGLGVAAAGAHGGSAGTNSSAGEDAAPARTKPLRPGTAAAADETGTPPRRSPVFLLRNVRSVHAVDVRRSLPAVPPSFLQTEVVAEFSRLVRPSSHPARIDNGGPAGAPSIEDAEPASVRLFGAFPRPFRVPTPVRDGSETKK